MKSFAYLSAPDMDTALRSITSEPRAKFLAGGTNLVDLMREGIERPETVIDITGCRWTASKNSPTAGCGSGRWCAIVAWLRTP